MLTTVISLNARGYFVIMMFFAPIIVCSTTFMVKRCSSAMENAKDGQDYSDHGKSSRTIVYSNRNLV